MKNKRTKKLNGQEREAINKEIIAGASMILNDDERAVLAAAVVAAHGLTREQAMNDKGIEAEVLRVWKWAEGVKLDNGLLTNVLDGGMILEFPDGSNEPLFKLTEQGIKYVETELLPEAVRSHLKKGEATAGG